MPAALRTFALLTAAVAAQASTARTEAELDRQVVPILVTFARSAETYKVPSRARAVYAQILDHYDIDNAAARAGLGYKRDKDGWRQVTPPEKLPGDSATAPQAKNAEGAWQVARKRVGQLHREFGLRLLADGEVARGRHHVERALAFVPEDVEAHRALGHEEFDGFYGSAEQIAFVRRMRAILAKAREVAALEVEVQPIPADAMPRALAKSGLPFAGAKSKNFQHWVAGTDEEAANSVRWAERALAMLEHLFGDAPAARKLLLPRRVIWLAIVRTPEQRQALLAADAKLLGDLRPEQLLLVGGNMFAIGSGWAEWSHYHGNDSDRAVGHVANRCGCGWFNDGLSEGLVHAMTWLLCSTVESSYMKPPTTVAGKDAVVRDPVVWLRDLRASIESGEDWPLVQVPRERLENFRTPVRTKAWTFVLWLLARHPDQWMHLLNELDKDTLQVEDVSAAFTKVLERSLGEVEEEWRQWARAGSPIGKASGLPQ